MSSSRRFPGPSLPWLIGVVFLAIVAGLSLAVWQPYQRTQQLSHEIKRLNGTVFIETSLPLWMADVKKGWGSGRWVWLFETRVTTITLVDAEIDDAWLRHLTHCKSLEALDLTGTPITDAGLSHLSNLPKLKFLAVSDTQVTGTGLAALNSPLEVLWISRSPCNDAAMVELRRFPPLSWIDVSDSDVTDAGAAHLAGCSNLEIVDLSGSQVSAASVKVLVGLPKLKVLKLRQLPFIDADVVCLSAAKNLRELDLADTRVTGATLVGLPDLLYLDLSRCPTDEFGLQCLPQCAQLILDGSPVSDEGARTMAILQTNVSDLKLSNSKVTDRGLRCLALLPALASLSLKGTACSPTAVVQFHKLRADLGLSEVYVVEPWEP